MRDAEADIAEALSNDGWLTVLDGPLHGIRHRDRGPYSVMAGMRRGDVSAITRGGGTSNRRAGPLAGRAERRRRSLVHTSGRSGGNDQRGARRRHSLSCRHFRTAVSL